MSLWRVPRSERFRLSGTRAEGTREYGSRARFASVINSGTFFGMGKFSGTKKNQTFIAPFRYGATLAQLPCPDYRPSMTDVNAQGDILLTGGSWTKRSNYRDDWYADFGFVDVDKLIVGDTSDLLLWNVGRGATMEIGNRFNFADAGQIVGNLYDVSEYGMFYVLTPFPLD
jgi:hypothetical protein